MTIQIKEALTFDDVLLVPAESKVLPNAVDTTSRIAKNIPLSVPIVSAAMDTVTEARLAIAMAQNGGIGCIHKNFTIEQQAEEVRKVKRFESGMVVNPVTINPSATLGEVFSIINEKKISGIPVVDNENKLVGIITNRDMRFADDPSQSVQELMTKDVVTVKQNTSKEEIRKLLHKHRIERLVVVDDENRCIGLITVKDMEKAVKFPNATRDEFGKLRTLAAVGVTDDGRAEALIEAGVDGIIVDTAHGHSKAVLDAVARTKKRNSNISVIAGNIATEEGAKALIDAGADTVKVGIGPGSICTTRIIAGVGMPQLSAVMDVVKYCRDKDIPVIADGGIKYSGDFAKAIAGGADCVMIGSLFAGTAEAPGEVVLYQGRSYKAYRGMGSIGAMSRGSADRYFQEEIKDKKLVPEGVEGRVSFKGELSGVIHQLIGGLKASMGYTGNENIQDMQTKCKFVKITNAGLRESHAHDVVITHETPNYQREG